MFGADTDNSWTTRSNLIRVLELKGRYREALVEREAILSSEEQLVADTRPDAIAFATNFIGVDHRELGELDAAEASLRRSGAVEAGQGDNAQPASTAAMSNLSLTLVLKGDYAQAEQLLRATLAIQRQHDAPNSQWLNVTRGAIGNVLRLQPRYEEALVDLRAANKAMTSPAGARNPWLVMLGAQLVEAELDAGHTAEAARIADDVLSDARRHLAANGVILRRRSMQRRARGSPTLVPRRPKAWRTKHLPFVARCCRRTIRACWRSMSYSSPRCGRKERATKQQRSSTILRRGSLRRRRRMKMICANGWR